MPHKLFRTKALTKLTNEIGVYALCDLDEVPLYVGKSVDGIRSRVRRHLTSARSDIIANRLVDIWEVAYVWAWPVGRNKITAVEGMLFEEFNTKKPLMNGSILTGHSPDPLPEKQVVQILPEEEIEKRRQPNVRLPRQIAHFHALMEYILEVKDEEQTRRALAAHYARLSDYYEQFMSTKPGKGGKSKGKSRRQRH